MGHRADRLVAWSVVRLVAASANGRMDWEIATELGTGIKTVCRWCRRFAEKGLAGIENNSPRSGRLAVSWAALEAENIRKTTAGNTPGRRTTARGRLPLSWAHRRR
jgi:hypothetical protein